MDDHYEIDFKNRTPKQIKFCSKHILENVLPIASRHNGKAFGGFVRDIIVPHCKLGKKLTECDNFKDLDLWFPTIEDVENFRDEIELSGNPISLISPHDNDGGSGKTLYEFKMFTGTLMIEDICISLVDLIISPKLPVNDFNINSITVEVLTDGTISFNSEKHDCFDLIKDIEKQTVRMEKKYFNKIRKNDDHSKCILSRIKKRYIDRNWTIMVKDEEFSLDSFQEKTSFLLKTSFQDTANNFMKDNKHLKFGLKISNFKYKIESKSFKY